MRGLRYSVLALTIGVSAGALAAPEPANNNGAMVFPNVRVVTPAIAPSATAPVTARAQTGMRGYLNPETGQIGGEFTAADAAALNPQTQVVQAERSKSAASPFFTAANGNAIGVNLSLLDDDGDLMPFSVVRREANGAMRYMCVQGKKDALTFIKAPVAEARNVR